MWKSLIRICTVLGVIFVLPPLLFYCWIQWKYYNIARNPVYQTVMTDFEIHDEYHKDITSWLEAKGIKEVQCFIFQCHPQRPSYKILIIGKCAEDAELVPNSRRTHPLEEHTKIHTALKLAGATPEKDGVFQEISPRLYFYKEWIIFETDGDNTPFLPDDSSKQEYLEKIICRKTRSSP